MPTHFLGLKGAATLGTGQFNLAGRVIDDLIKNCAVGVIHGPAGTGKTFAVNFHLEALRDVGDERVVTCSLAFPSEPTMLRVAMELTRAITGVAPPNTRSRFQLINTLIGLLAGPRRLVVIDEAQRLNGACIEMIRHLHDHHQTSFALLYVGGDGCWEVLSREPMLRSRVFRRLPFKPVAREQVPALMRGYHPIYAETDEELLLDVDDAYAHGTLRDWAVFTHTAAELCREAKLTGLNAEVTANAYMLLGTAL